MSGEQTTEPSLATALVGKTRHQCLSSLIEDRKPTLTEDESITFAPGADELGNPASSPNYDHSRMTSINRSAGGASSTQSLFCAILELLTEEELAPAVLAPHTPQVAADAAAAAQHDGVLLLTAAMLVADGSAPAAFGRLETLHALPAPATLHVQTESSTLEQLLRAAIQPVVQEFIAKNLPNMLQHLLHEEQAEQ